jgi:hypothetical protein
MGMLTADSRKRWTISIRVKFTNPEHGKEFGLESTGTMADLEKY